MFEADKRLAGYAEQLDWRGLAMGEGDGAAQSSRQHICGSRLSFRLSVDIAHTSGSLF